MKLDPKYDLHCHSTCSDGSLSPKELIDLAVKNGLQGISITDHDTTEAYSEKTIAYAKKKGIQLIFGVEISTTFLGQSIHVLCYGLTKQIAALIQRVHEKRQKRNCKIVEFLADKGIEISLNEIQENSNTTSLGRPHIANELVRRKIVKDFRQAFNLYLSDEKLCHIQDWGLDTKECLSFIKKAQGKAVLAHPHLIKSQKALSKILNLGFDGIECYYANFSYDCVQEYLNIAKRENLCVTGGSDFHGAFKPKIELGASYTNQIDFDRL